MAALWHLVYWPAIGFVLLLSVVNFVIAFLTHIAATVGLYAERKLDERK